MATGLTFGSQHPDEDEFISFERVPFDALLDRCLSGDLRDGKTVAGVLKVYALRTRKRGRRNEHGAEKTVLIVEDEVNIVDIVRFNLQREGLRHARRPTTARQVSRSRARRSPTSSCST